MRFCGIYLRATAHWCPIILDGDNSDINIVVFELILQTDIMSFSWEIALIWMPIDFTDD